MEKRDGSTRAREGRQCPRAREGSRVARAFDRFAQGLSAANEFGARAGEGGGYGGCGWRRGCG